MKGRGGGVYATLFWGGVGVGGRLVLFTNYVHAEGFCNKWSKILCYFSFTPRLNRLFT